jgi:hypothetical protein
MIPEVVLKITQALPPVFIHLWGSELKETANLFRNSVKELLDKAIAISFALKHWDDMAQLVHTAFTINSYKNQQQFQEIYSWALKVLTGIPDGSRRKMWLDWLEEKSQTFDPSKNKIEIQEPEVPSDEEYQIVIQMAKAMGIDIDNPNDKIAQVVKIGLQDLNPERVLKNCKHLFVYVGHYGIPAEMLKLYTAGSKYLRCLKKDVAFGGLSLDGIYGLMSKKCCLDCKDKEPWPDNWKWTRSWQNGESEKEVHKIFDQKIHS